MCVCACLCLHHGKQTACSAYSRDKASSFAQSRPVRHRQQLGAEHTEVSQKKPHTPKEDEATEAETAKKTKRKTATEAAAADYGLVICSCMKLEWFYLFF